MSKRSSTRKSATVLGIVGTAMALVVGANASANAATYVNAGSDTLQNVTSALTNEYAANVDPGGNNWVTVNSDVSQGGVNTGKAACDTNYGTNGRRPSWPGSHASGIRDLLNQRGKLLENCLSFVRVARSPRNLSEETALTWVRVAADSVTWATKKPGIPTDLTQRQLQDIFKCVITDWSQIPGSTASGPIQKYLPSGYYSDVRAVFTEKVLGFDPTAAANGSCSTTIVGIPTENQGTQATSTNAIMPYSKAAYSAQTNPASGVLNRTDGFILGNIDGKAPGEGDTSPNSFPGNNSVYFVYDPLYDATARETIAFIDWAANPAQRPIWAAYGFRP
ncbi:substrate-binding domain-containing protein [Embleya sp. AB8]|uniref:substrate-binding domain-containing protein n=1 Tax=Embleya sp. AB8 TaxID=3156304 RepID=UPI003C71E5C2